MSNNDKNPENIHSATTPEECEKMEQKYGWKLKDIRFNKEQKILKVDCVFEGEQTSFEDSRYDD
ncbi:MAG: hypothetical protein SWX82_01115 [Cyanobacteriota bacterium]|nr:hypothetical protein [Cyanobacteriota bacterium]